MSEIEFPCPHCKETVSVDSSYAGRVGQCPYCDEKTRIPEQSKSQQPAVPTPQRQNMDTTGLGLGIASLAMGIMALVIAWVPFLGLVTLPVAAIGGLLGIIGIIIPLVTKRRGVGFPIAGLITCVVAVGIQGVATGVAAYRASALVEDFSYTPSYTPPTVVPFAEDLGGSVKIEGIAEADYARDHVVMYDVASAYFDTYLDGRVPGVVFKLKNTGTRPLKTVRVRFYFRDATGAIIAEEDYYPVNADSLSFDSLGKVLKPGYIWQLEKDKFLRAPSVPSEWQEGSGRFEILSVEFADDVE